jgi:hypothetical protein
MSPLQEKRVALYRAFEARFREPRGFRAPPEPVPVDPEAVGRVEVALNCRFPDSYRTFVTTVGPCDVRGLSDARRALRRESASYPLPFESLWHPDNSLRQCGEAWYAPIPAELAGGAAVDSDVAWKYLLPFGSDGSGNWHCFPRQPFPAPDLPVYYFDHDGGDMERLAEGFDDLIERFLAMPAR